MRVFLLLSLLLMGACASQPAPVSADRERSATKVSSDWECDPKSSGLWSCSAARRAPVAEPVAEPVAGPVAEPVAGPVAGPVAEPVAEPVASKSAPPVEGAGGADMPVHAATQGAYVLQVGAYRQRQQAEKAVRQIGEPQLVIVPTRRGEEDWYVLLLGTYDDIAQARAAAAAYLNANPRGVSWVRSAADLRHSRTAR